MMNTLNVSLQTPTTHPPNTETTEVALATASPPVPTVQDTLSSKRPLNVIEDEILLHSGKTVEDFIMAGKGLNEAKEIVEPGQWLKWLSTKVYIAPREAQRFMQVAEAYKNYISTAKKLGITKALALLKIPDDERENFINSPHEVADGQLKTVFDMKVRELDQAIRKEMGLKNKNTISPIRKPTRQKFIKDLAAVQEHIDGILRYLEYNAQASEISEEFHDSICALNEKFTKLMSLVNSETSNETEIKKVVEGEK